MIPPFDLQGGAPLAIARGVAVAGWLSVTGVLAFRSLVLPRALAGAPADLCGAVGRRLTVLAQVSIAAAFVATLAWLVLAAGGMADADSARATFAAVPAVLRTTAFGHVTALQLAALPLLAAVIGLRGVPGIRQHAAFGLAAAALCLQAGHSHAAAMEGGPGLLLGMDVLHLLGAAGWLGGLIPLLIVVRHAPPRLGALAARWFSPLGQCCILLLVASAAVQGWVLVGSLPGLVGTAYGWMVLVKAALFAVLLGFAAANRYRFAPALLRGDHRRVLARSIALQTGAALAIVAAAIVLSGLPPAMHLQPIWPFSRRPDFAAVREDPEFLREVVLAGLALAAGLAVLGAAVLRRRFRLPVAAFAAVIAWCAIPHFDLLLADATPESYFRSPTGFAADSIAAGAGLYGSNCAICHGATGLGDGKLARTLAVPPANLTAAHVLMHDDGEMFGWLTEGIRSAEGAQVMPGFASRLDETARWALIDFVRAHNQGAALRTEGGWRQPLRAPGFQLQCGDSARQLADLDASFVRLVIGAAPAGAATPGLVTPGLVTIGTLPGPAGGCVAGDAAVVAAYAILAGREPAALAGAQFLIDGAGWLRAIQLPGAAPGWDAAGALSATLLALRQHPVSPAPVASAPAGMHMDMKM